MLLNIESRRIDPDITVIEFSGKITMSAERLEIENMVEDLVRKNQRKVIFDLAGVEYIDSTGMGTIVVCFNKVKQGGGQLRVAGTQERVTKIFKITRLDTVLAFYPTTQAAAENPW